MNMAFSFSPEKNNISENIKLDNADISKSISVMLNRLNMIFFLINYYNFTVSPMPPFAP